MSLTRILQDVDTCVSQYSVFRDKDLYRLLRTQTINLNGLRKGEYTYYYGMVRSRTVIDKTW